MLCPIVLAGGSGSRLWPLSRSHYPKQFLSLVNTYSMLQETTKRLHGFDAIEPIVICNEEHRFIVAEQLRSEGVKGRIVLEPVGRSTAPAIAVAAHIASQKDDPLLLVLAADHHITNEAEFSAVVTKALPLAEAGSLVTFGIVPTSANTEYGYIKRGDKKGAGYSVDSFIEKPNQMMAEQYVEDGQFYWNSGMFLFKASRYLDELKKFRADITNACEKSVGKISMDLDFIRIDEKAFCACPAESVDYAVMEHTADAVVVPLDAGWSDVGSWAAIWDLSSKSEDGNTLHDDVFYYDSKNCFVHSQDRLIATVGLEDVVIVDTKDALLVADKNSVHKVKNVVETLKEQEREEVLKHKEVFRPWGKYESVDWGTRYQVKRITVKPGAKLSVQMHHHRAEHWVVVSGTAKVTKGSKTFLVSENQSTYIPIGEVHALENPGKLPLELIEVQSGSYLGEDDIIRIEDNYGRI